MALAFLDVESTHLDPRLAEVYEIAVAIDNAPVESWFLPHSLATADPAALDIGNYWGREVETAGDPIADLVVRELLQDKTLVISNPPFDRDLLFRRWGVQPWHHRSVDISTYAMGILGHAWPRGLFDVARELRQVYQFDIPEPDHTAGGDVATLRACFRALQEVSGA